jgi:PTH1 family peptidyl-tRNA hydrolase
MADWVLARLSGQDKAQLEQAARRAADAVECLLSEGMEKAMSNYN